jgi:hypothetical protein
MFSGKTRTEEEIKANLEQAKEYENVKIRLLQLLQQNAPIIEDAEVNFKTATIRLDFICFFDSPLFVYLTLSNREEDKEIDTIQKFCEKARIKLLIYTVKKDNTDLEIKYKDGIRKLYDFLNPDMLVVYQ